MNILFNLGIYMPASSLTMVGYVWIRYIKHSHSEFKQLQQINTYTEETQSSAESVAA